MDYKLTIDGNILQVAGSHEPINTLKRWKNEGRIDLIEAAAPAGRNPTSTSPNYGWPGSPQRPAAGYRNARSKKPPAGSLKFGNVSSVLFPTKDSQKLNMAEINNVAHLIKHHNSKNELFITENRKDFLDGGRREQLKTHYGIVAMTPEEAVETLTKLEGWK